MVLSAIPKGQMRTVNDIMEEIQIGIMDAQSDYPHLSLEDITREVVRSLTADLDPSLAASVLRRSGLGNI
jgi:hypothetical protein